MVRELTGEVVCGTTGPVLTGCVGGVLAWRGLDARPSLLPVVELVGRLAPLE